MISRRILCLLFGAACFWTPTTVLEVTARHELNLVLGTLVPPVALLSAYLVARRAFHLRYSALWMLAGVFILGPLFMTAGATALHAGFLQFTGWRDIGYLALECLVPPLTLVLAGYDGTLFGVLLATLLMPLLHWWTNRRNARLVRKVGASG